MNNRERMVEAESYHIMIALRRKKSNDRRLKELCFREIVYDSDRVAMNCLKARIDNRPGIWRIYKTVNKRDVNPAWKLLFKMMIDEPDKFKWRIGSAWKNCLLKKENRAEKKYMLDVDVDIIPEKLDLLMGSVHMNVLEKIKTPNGWHIICDAFDTRMLEGIQDIEIKRNDIKFICEFENEITNEQLIEKVLDKYDKFQKVDEELLTLDVIKAKHQDLINLRDYAIDKISEGCGKPIYISSNPKTFSSCAKEIHCKDCQEEIKTLREIK